LSARPLILVTRPGGPGDPLVAALEERGHRVAAVPTVVTRDVDPGGPLDAALASPEAWDWVVVTSATGARAVGGALARTGTRVRTIGRPRWAAVGPATAAELARLGIHVDLVPADASGLAIARDLARETVLRGDRILLARAEAAAPDLPEALRDAGADVHEVLAYYTIEGPAESAAAISIALADDALAAIVVASGSAARGLLALAAGAGRTPRALATPVVSIGPRTTAIARALGFLRITEADEPSVNALTVAVDAAHRAPAPRLPRRLP
jgi:uroporphyrinogen III methyltransferase/synthase